jgi:hypothetical protein
MVISCGEVNGEATERDAHHAPHHGAVVSDEALRDGHRENPGNHLGDHLGDHPGDRRARQRPHPGHFEDSSLVKLRVGSCSFFLKQKTVEVVERGKSTVSLFVKQKKRSWGFTSDCATFPFQAV